MSQSGSVGQRELAGLSAGQLDTVMQEQRLFPPRAEFAARAKIKSLTEYEKLWNDAAADLEKFWANLAGELHWFKPYTKVLDWNEPFAKWFVGGQTNASYNCLDAHLTTPRRTKRRSSGKASRATRARSPTSNYISRSASLPTRLQASAYAKATECRSTCRWCRSWRLRCWPARASAPSTQSSSAAFPAKQSPTATTTRKRQLVITADSGWRRGQQLPLKENVDAALVKSPSVKHCIVYKRGNLQVEMQKGRDHWWHEFVSHANADCPATPLDSESPLFILYTSGSTGKPKGIKHTTAGYNLFVKKTFEWVFDHRDEDLFWCTADCGWVTGHSYVVYGPLSAGAPC